MTEAGIVTLTLPGVFVEYLKGTSVWYGDDVHDLGSVELGNALRSAPKRKVGKGYNVTVSLSPTALDVVRDYALDLTDTYGADHDSSWPKAGRTVLDRVETARDEIAR